jgi:molecular chaperone GrpE (heat shock protein)
MNQSMSIPIKVRTPVRRELPPNGSRAEDTRAEPVRLPSEGNSAQETPVSTVERPNPALAASEDTQSELQEWRDRALRLQADMDNYRRRQRRLAQDEMLQKEGVERFEAGGHPFDPAWHEAVATVRRNGTQTDLNTVVQVMEPGYRMGDRLLRPAKVVVSI